MVNTATQKWIDKLKNKTSAPASSNTSLKDTYAQLKKRNDEAQKGYEVQISPVISNKIVDKFWNQQNFFDTAVEIGQKQWANWQKLLNQLNVWLQWTDIPTNGSWFIPNPNQINQTNTNTWYFTPKQLQMIADAWYTEQTLMNEIVKVWQKQWVDWNKLLNQANAAFQWSNIPSVVWSESENANKMLSNDREGFVAPDDALTWMINKTFPNLWTQLNKWYENTYNVWQDIEWMLKEEMMKYQSAYWPDWTMRKMLDEEIASQQQRLGQEKELMNVQYWLTNAGIDTNAIESWASSWQVAASKAAANKQSLLQQAEYNDRLAKFGTDKLKSYQDMEDKLSTYMQDYITKYGTSKDKYVIDNFNNLVNLQSNLAIQIKNLEAQNKALAADAANTAAIANAMWGKATSTPTPTWPWAIDQLPAWYYDWLTQWWQAPVWTTTTQPVTDTWIQYTPYSWWTWWVGWTWDALVWTWAVAWINQPYNIANWPVQMPWVTRKSNTEIVINDLRNKIIPLQEKISKQWWTAYEIQQLNTLKKELIDAEALYRTL